MTSSSLRAAAETARSAAPLNEAQRLALFNPDPEVNSLAERVVALRRHGVPDADIRALLADIRQVLEFNAAEGRRNAQACKQLDDIVALLDMQAVIEKPSIKRWVSQIRPHLAVLRHPERYDGIALPIARRTVAELLAVCPASYLTAPTTERQLGEGPYRQLLELANAQSQSRDSR